MTYDKLIRDKIPAIIESSGKIALTQELSDEEYLKALDQKLHEELAEYEEAHALEELADLLEVLYASALARGYSIEALETCRLKKREARGGFEEKLCLKEVKDR